MTTQNTEVAFLTLQFTPGSPYLRPYLTSGQGQTIPFKGKGVLEDLRIRLGLPQTEIQNT